MHETQKTKLQILKGTYQIAKLPPDAGIPPKVLTQAFYTVSKTRDELSIIAPDDVPIPSEHCQKGWKVLQFVESMDFSLVGVMARIAAVLAKSGISLCAVSTYNTDYVLIKNENLKFAVKALEEAGYAFAR